MVTIARENLENKDPKVMEMSEEGEEQQEELNILSEDKGPGRFRNPNLANLICYKCGRELWKRMSRGKSGHGAIGG